MPALERVWIDSLYKGRTKLLENVRILLYKENQQFFELLDYENDRIFNEPFLFAYFYANKSNATLEQLLFGHIEKSKRPKAIKAKSDEQGLIYLPEIGWLKTDLQNEIVTVGIDETVNGLSVLVHGSKMPFTFEPILKIDTTLFEIVYHQHPLLAPHYFDSKNKLVNVEIDTITAKQKDNLAKAFVLIRNSAPEFYNLLEEAIKKVVIFNDPSTKRNSFATVSVHGCAFFNSFQPEYDEVFFIEDIAHQCGHVIFNNITHGNKDIFKIHSETVIKEKGLWGIIMNLLEKRTLFVAFHALFTYYGITICLEACLLKSELSELQKHEVLGRLAFCFRKYGNDIKLLGKLDKEGQSIYFTEEGLALYKPMENLYNRIKIEWGERLRKINLLNQPYNFSVKNFFKSNPIEVDENRR
ncbi:MAG: hypothetical protein KA713_03135 [Chryseotalea sp. WA131a]|nr:MAG: hypothetical protein KA713_03135 [Chryseotalea sp. WA131a]